MLAVAAAFGPPVGFAHRPEQVWLGELAIASVNAPALSPGRNVAHGQVASAVTRRGAAGHSLSLG